MSVDCLNIRIIISQNIKQILRLLISCLFFFNVSLYQMREDFAEYTKCNVCDTSLLMCLCNCPKCGKREDCKCELKQIRYRDLGY